MGVSMSGLVSNMDTDSIVTAMVSGYVTKKENLQKDQTRLQWTQDAWKDLNKKVYSFYSKELSAMRFSNAFQVKKSTSSDETKAKVTGSSSAVSGTQTLKIKQLATTGYLTGGVVKNATNASEKIKATDTLEKLGITDTGAISVVVDGEEQTISVSKDMSINEFVTQLKSAGLNASFDENNQRFFVSSKVSGAEGDFSITANSEAGKMALQNMGLYSVTSADISAYEKFAAYTDDEIATMAKKAYTKNVLNQQIADNQTIMSDISSVTSGIATAMESENLPAEYESMVLKDADGNVTGYNFEKYREYLNTLTEENSTELTDDAKAKIEQLDRLEASGVIADTSNVNKEDLTKKAEELATENTEIQEVLADETLLAAKVQEFETAGDFTSANADYQAIVDSYNTQRDTAQNMVAQYELVKKYEANDTSVTAEQYAAAKLALGMTDNDGTGAVRIVGQDAQIELNGAIFTSNTSTFSINGLTIQANAVTKDDEVITINTDTDAEGIYNTIKDFFKSYNELIKEMETLYNADSSKGYDPLTDDEKEAMSEKEIEKWEEKIKDSLLRRDSTLDSIMTSIKNSMLSVFEIDGKKYSLSSFGIKTSSYFTAGENEKGVFHIDGDEDDDSTSGETDKLMAAIAQNPEAVAEFFNKLAEKTYETLTQKMSRTTLSSAYTIYNDKYMQTQYNNYTEQIEKWEDRITTLEDRYRSQFTAMEKALAQLNSNSSYFSSLLG